MPIFGISGAKFLCGATRGSQRPHCEKCGLGAERQTVLGMIFGRGMTTIGAGLAVGLPAAWAVARLMASLIYGVTANDAATFVAIPLALVAAAALAIYIPARRAMKIDPIVALRYE
jgi:putative ABC transport system permease protein